MLLMLPLLPAVELGVTGVEAEPGASLNSRKRLAPPIHGGQGGSLVPPYTCGCISLFPLVQRRMIRTSARRACTGT